MNLKALTKVLLKHGEKSEEGVSFAEDAAISLYVGLGNDSLVIAQIKAVSFEDELLVASTKKNESFTLASEDVRIVRVGKETAKKRTGLI